MSRRSQRLVKGRYYQGEDDAASNSSTGSASGNPVSYRESPVRIFKKKSTTKRQTPQYSTYTSNESLASYTSDALEEPIKNWGGQSHFLKKAVVFLLALLLLGIGLWYFYPLVWNQSDTVVPDPVWKIVDESKAALSQDSKAPASKQEEITLLLQDREEKWREELEQLHHKSEVFRNRSAALGQTIALWGGEVTGSGSQCPETGAQHWGKPSP
ncbi:UNVERIFIED_CONTAM: hypothetical protein FKN15_037384 [Acipenser sinensis]